MEQYVIEGQTKLRGVLPVHGAKNAALPILAGTLLVPGVCEIHNCPALSDVAAAAAILQSLGCRVQQEPGGSDRRCYGHERHLYFRRNDAYHALQHAVFTGDSQSGRQRHRMLSRWVRYWTATH